jgi:hypothetical protein
MDDIIKAFDRAGMSDRWVFTFHMGSFFEPYGRASETWECVYEVEAYASPDEYHKFRSRRNEKVEEFISRVKHSLKEVGIPIKESDKF